MTVSTEQIRQQGADPHCAFYSVMNLYVWAGLEPPTIEEILAFLRSQYVDASEWTGGNVIFQQAVLTAFKFPRLFAHAMIPAHKEARDYFPGLLDQGFGLLIGLFFTVDGEWYGHSVVAESWSEEGLTVLDSGDDFDGDGKTMKWHMASRDAPIDPQPHGRRIVVPWLTQDYDVWTGVDQRSQPVGIARDFIVVWPE